MSNPVAIRYDFDGYGYQYMDSGSGSDWQTRVEGELLYTHPAKTLTDSEYDNIFANGKRLGVLETEYKFRKAKTLTDEEIDELANQHLSAFTALGCCCAHFEGEIEFARAILKKASEK